MILKDVKKTDKDIVGIILLITSIALMGFNFQNLDYGNYQESYNTLTHIKGLEFSYYILQILGQNAGLSYAQFKFVTSLLGLLLMYHTIHLYTQKTWPYFVLYFVYPFCLDIIIVRNFLGMSVFLYALTFLRKDGQFNTVIYLFLIIIASGFHNIFLLFLPFVFFHNMEKHKVLRYSIYLLGLVCILMMFFPSVISFFVDCIMLLLRLIMTDSSRLEYVNAIHTRFGFIILLFEALACVFISYQEMQVVCDYASVEDVTKGKYDLFVIQYYLSLYMLLFCPLYRLHAQFARTIQNILPLMHLTFLVFLQLTKGKYEKDRLKISISYLLFVLFMVIHVLLFSPWKEILYPIFKYNYLWY